MQNVYIRCITCIDNCKYVLIVHCVYWVYVCVFCTLSSVSMYCVYVNCFCTVWSTPSRISLTKKNVLWWSDNKSDLICSLRVYSLLLPVIWTIIVICWVIFRGQYICTSIQAARWLLSQVSFVQYCPLINYTTFVAEMWGVYSLLWDTVYKAHWASYEISILQHPRSGLTKFLEVCLYSHDLPSVILHTLCYIIHSLDHCGHTL